MPAEEFDAPNPVRAIDAEDIDAEDIDAEDKCAELCHEANRALCISFGDHSQSHWHSAPEWQQESALAGVRAIRTADPKKITPGMSHEAWATHKRADGWVWGAEKDANAKTHPCLVPFDQLPPHQQAKDRVFLAIVLAFFGI